MTPIRLDRAKALAYFRSEQQHYECLVRQVKAQMPETIRVCGARSLEAQGSRESIAQDSERASWYRWAADALERKP